MPPAIQSHIGSTVGAVPHMATGVCNRAMQQECTATVPGYLNCVLHCTLVVLYRHNAVQLWTISKNMPIRGAAGARNRSPTNTASPLLSLGIKEKSRT